MERQKLMRMTERSDRMYLQVNSRKQINKTLSFSIMLVGMHSPEDLQPRSHSAYD